MAVPLKTLRIILRDSDFLDRKSGESGEIFYDKNANTLRLYDGKAKSGTALSRADLDNVTTAAFRAKTVESRLATVIYTVTVAGPQAPDVGNKYVLNGVYRPVLNLVVGYTYVFDQSDDTNVYFPNAVGTTVNRHALNFSADNISGERGGGTSYLADVEYRLNELVVTQAVYNSAAFNTATARQVQITVTNATPAILYYWCYNHVLMGNEIAVADPGSGTGSSSSIVAGFGITITEVNDISTVSNSGVVSLTAGAGISVVETNGVGTVTNNGVLGITAGSGITTSVNQGVVTIDSVANTGNVTFTGRTVDSDDSTAITFTPSVIFDSDVSVYEIVFPDGSIQVSAAGPTPGPQGVQGPAGAAGPVGSGAGDVVSLAVPVTDNALIRYHETSGTIIQNSSASLSDAGLLTATAFSGSGANITGLDAVNLAEGTVPDARFPATLPTASGANLTALNATNLGSGTVPDARFPATLPTASGANLTALNAANLASGTVPVARLGTAGVRDATTFLRGDNTFAVVAGVGGAASDSFATIAVAGQSNVVADSATDTLTLAAGANVTITTDAGTDTITIAASTAAAQNVFSTIAVSGQSDVIADTATDTLTLVAGTNITIATNAGTDTITINSTAAGGATAFTGLSDASDLTVDRFYLPAITMLNVTANGVTAYRFDQYGATNNPTIYAINGTTIAFNLAGASGHPFVIRDAALNPYSTGLVHVTTGGTVNTGSSAQGKQSGTLYWKIPDSISGNYGYVCSSHALAMVGTIVVKNFPSI